MMGKFEKGQYVRVLHTDYAEVLAVGDIFNVGEALDHGVSPEGEKSEWFFLNREIEPWLPKVGERVRFLRDSTAGGARFGAKDQLATVTRVPAWDTHLDNPWVEVKLEASEITFNPSAYIEDLAPVAAPATLTIEAGKFYKTRDGRKIGPMVARDGYLTADFFHYSAGGECCYLGQSGDDTYPKRDLVAEWVDEPKASNDNSVKVGDVIRATEDDIDITSGSLYEVLDVYENGDVRVKDDVGDNWTLGSATFEKRGDADVANDNAPAAERTADTSNPLFTFKVGDKAKTRDGRIVTITHADQTPDYPFAHDMGDGRYHAVDPSGKSCIGCDEDDIVEALSKPSPAIVALIEGGKVKPATRPKVHPDQATATTEAERLAMAHPGQQFGVFVLADSKIADVISETVQRTVLRAA